MTSYSHNMIYLEAIETPQNKLSSNKLSKIWKWAFTIYFTRNYNHKKSCNYLPRIYTPPPPFHMSFSYAKGEPHVISIGVFPRRRWKTLNRLKVACSLCYMITLSIRVIVMNCDNVHTGTCSMINSLHPITFLHFLLKFLKRTLRENHEEMFFNTAYGDNDIMSTDRELIDVIQYRFESCFDNGHFSKNRSMSHTSIFSIRNQPTLST